MSQCIIINGIQLALVSIILILAVPLCVLTINIINKHDEGEAMIFISLIPAFIILLILTVPGSITSDKVSSLFNDTDIGFNLDVDTKTNTAIIYRKGDNCYSYIKINNIK